MTRRIVAVLGTAMVLLMLSAAPASAHASLESTEPAADAVLDDAPDSVELRFTEPVEAGLGGIRVIAPDGRRADDGSIDAIDGGVRMRTAVDASTEGTYTVAWSVTSEDGHLIAGSFLFSVGRATDPAEVAAAGRVGVRLLAGVTRWIAFGGTMLLAGVLVFDVLVRRRAAARLGTATAGLLGAIAVAAASAVLLWTHAALAAEKSLVSSLGLIDDVARETRFGQLGFVRLSFALSAAGLTSLRRGRALRWLTVAALVPTVGLLVVPALAGHAWTTSPSGLAVAVDALHLAAVAMWTGGLVALLLHRRDTDVALLARRFSSFALGLVAVVVVTGSVSSYLQVRTLEGLETGYGRLLAVKVVLVLVVVGVASLTRSIVKQRDNDDNLMKLVASEVAIVLVVLGVTAALVNQPPARSSIVQPISTTVEMDGSIAAVQIQVEPARTGLNDIHLYFIGEDGLPTPVDAVEMAVARADVPPRRVEITPVTADHVSAYRVSLPSPGRWTLAITAVSVGATSTAELDVEIR